MMEMWVKVAIWTSAMGMVTFRVTMLSSLRPLVREASLVKPPVTF